MIAGDILVIKGDDRISRFICWLEKSPYSHSAVAIDSEHIIEAEMFQKICITEMYYTTNYKVLRADLTNSQRTALVKNAKTFVGKRYDYIGALKWVVRLLLNPGKYGARADNSFYCSALVDHIYQHVGIDLVPHRKNRKKGDILPVEIECSPILTEVESFF